MTDAALEHRGDESGSHWARRAVLVTFCVLLLGTLSVVFTRVVAARVPQQRANLEKLITDRTGLAVRFDNVHFAWNLDGMSAVFERVELTDPKQGRVRVVAPALSVEFDTWDYLRHHQFSLGHVTLSSPDIEIIGDAIDMPAVSARAPGGGSHTAPTQEDEAALVRRFAAWAELMPNGRVEVEGARVHLKRRGDRAARNTFTLSQAVVTRGPTTFNAFGTMLLSQDVGQSLFLSAKLEGLSSASRVSGDLRLIARRVFLDRMPFIDAKGRGTLDATLHLQDGLIQSASWQASARELEFADGAHTRFDHLTVSGKLERDADDFLLQFADLQLTRGARLERAPNLSARVAVAPGTTRVARTTLSAERVPFMAAEFMTRLLAPQFEDRLAVPGGWTPTGGELRAVRFDSRATAGGWSFHADVAGADLERDVDHARVSHLSAQLQLGAGELALTFDPANAVNLHVPGAQESRALNLGGRVVALDSTDPTIQFENFTMSSDAGTLVAQGEWNGDLDDTASRAKTLVLTVSNLDRALLLDGWAMLARDDAAPAALADIEQGVIVDGSMTLLPRRIADSGREVNWQRSSGKLTLAGLASAGEDLPHLSAASGTLEFSRGHTKLLLDGGEVDQLTVTSARLDWPRTGAPRLHAALQGDLASPILRRTLKAQGLDRLAGTVTLEADARGEKEIRQPDLWRVSARFSDASMPLGGELPPVEKLSGTVRFAGGQLRGLALDGSWLGGPVEIESRRTATGNSSFAISGVADAAPLLRLLGKAEAANRVNGEIAWTATMQRLDDTWKVSLASTLAGVESRLPAPFDKPAARALPVSAQLRVDANGIREFELAANRDVLLRGAIENGVTTARFDVQGVTGELRRAGNSSEPHLQIERLDMRRSPTVLAAAAAMLPTNGELALGIDDLRYGSRSLGAMQATLTRLPDRVGFSLESTQTAQHQLAAQGQCVSGEPRCRLEFTADTEHLAALLRGVELPAEWPTETLHAAGELSWPADAQGELASELAGQFDLETEGSDSSHQLVASATLAEGQINLANVQGTGPEADQVFRGSGRVGLLAREYDLTVDYERVSMAASAVPTQARARVARAWTALRGSVARRGWTEIPEARRIQWHGTWDAE
jgi:uncharacterized protein YhdP